jgi:riboflavin-specific deaminase-like protein
MLPTRPRVLVNCAISLDGKLNPRPALRHGPFVMSRHPEDPRRMIELRAQADAIVVGAGNLRADDADLALTPGEHARRRAAGVPEPLRVVVTRRGEGVTPDRPMFDPTLGGASIVAHAATMPADARARLSPVATLFEAGEEEADIPALLRWLATERGVSTVLCEGGGIINAAFFAARAVDALFLTVCPRILGGFDAPMLVAGPGFAPDALADATLGSVEHLGDELFLRYDFTWT